MERLGLFTLNVTYITVLALTSVYMINLAKLLWDSSVSHVPTEDVHELE